MWAWGGAGAPPHPVKVGSGGARVRPPKNLVVPKLNANFKNAGSLTQSAEIGDRTDCGTHFKYEEVLGNAET